MYSILLYSSLHQGVYLLFYSVVNLSLT